MRFPKPQSQALHAYPLLGWRFSRVLAMFDGSKVVPSDQSRADRTRRYRTKPDTQANSTVIRPQLRSSLGQGSQDRRADLNAPLNKLMTEITSSQMPTHATANAVLWMRD